MTLTWTCHLCGEERDDKLISVFKTDISETYQVPPGTICINVRYCNDKLECIEGAPYHAFCKTKPEHDKDKIEA